ncbi:hypothetical protein LDO26_08140 [Luteimonas sp. BDR2-5]|uniref:hypothetical protein n=1 Tax=Proluteimonas luteida TaxID=2878685 RepID=UPI001E3836C2|nr:hypothetical protein [Luteimonas sp. BDR2-5]MCD9028178.1 hypothetical protein [Luteimonas sp. BDR2-5]
MRAEAPRAAHWRIAVAALVVASGLCACGGRDQPAPTGDTADEAPLPQPQTPHGPLTAMPANPGPGDVPLGGTPPASAPDALLPPLEDEPESGLLVPGAGAPDADAATQPPEPGPEEAAAVIRTYYAAINALDYPRAYALWSDGGRSSGQTPEAFAAGFADTAAVMVDIGAPRNADAAAGSRYIEVPVTLRAQQRDGGSRHFSGSYVLRRAVVDGASDVQRSWRIASADLREVPAP